MKRRRGGGEGGEGRGKQRENERERETPERGTPAWTLPGVADGGDGGNAANEEIHAWTMTEDLPWTKPTLSPTTGTSSSCPALSAEYEEKKENALAARYSAVVTCVRVATRKRGGGGAGSGGGGGVAGPS